MTDTPRRSALDYKTNASSSIASAIPSDDAMTTQAPHLDGATAEGLVYDIFGVKGAAKRLHSERDANFLIESGQDRYTFKVTNTAEPVHRTAFNTAVIAHIADRAPDAPVPHLIPTRNGALQTTASIGGQQNIVRLLTYLDGEQLKTVPTESRPIRNIGACIGHLAAALSDFDHPDMHYTLLWDSTNVDALAHLATYIPSTDQRRAVEMALDGFKRRVKPALAPLRQQVIHNDVNLGNVLVAGDPLHISGLIDFGDIVYAPAVNDLAVAASYQVADADVEKAIGIVSEMTAGYHEHFPLHFYEIDAIGDLMIARCLTTILVTHWRASIFPENAEYILRHNAVAWSGFHLLSTVNKERLASRIRARCCMET